MLKRLYLYRFKFNKQQMNVKTFYRKWCKIRSKKINLRTNEERNKQWTNLLTGFRPGDKKFWKLSRNLRWKGSNKIPTLLVGNIVLITDLEKV